MQSTTEVRKSFKTLGYSVSIRSNPFNPSLASLFVSGQGLQKLMISSGTVISTGTYEKHRVMFELANSFSGKIVGDKKII